MDIAAFVDTSGYNESLAIDLIAALAEFCIKKEVRLFLLADATTVLEVGLSLLGLRESRTIEGGRYRPSPIILLPLISRPDELESRILERSDMLDEGVDPVGGGIDELVSLGLFEQANEFDTLPGDVVMSSEVLADLISGVRPDLIIGVSHKREYWDAVEEGLDRIAVQYSPGVALIEGFSPSKFRPDLDISIAQLERAEILRPDDEIWDEDEMFAAVRDKAAAGGALLAGFCEFLYRWSAGLERSRYGSKP